MMNLLMPFRKITAVYSENHKELTGTLCEQNVKLPNVKTGGTYSYQ
jgi:hypothetical protein